MATGNNPGSRPEDTSAGRTDATNAGRSADQAQQSAAAAQTAAAQSEADAAAARQQAANAQRSNTTRVAAQNVSTERVPNQNFALRLVGGVLLILLVLFLVWNYGGRVVSWLKGQPDSVQTAANQQQPVAPATQVPAAPQATPVVPAGPVLQQTYAPPANVAAQILNLEREIEKKERALYALNPNCPDDKPEYDAIAARISVLRRKLDDLRLSSHTMTAQPVASNVMQMQRTEGQSIQYSGKGYYTTTAMDPETARYAFDVKRIRAEEQRDAAQREARILKATRDDRHEELMEELKRNRRLQENPPKQTHVHTHQHAYPTTTVRYVVPAPYCNY